MKHKRVIKKIEFIESLTIGLTVGLILSYSFGLNPLNGICMGLSLGLLLEKIIQEKKILLSIYILVGLLIGCIVSCIFDFSYANAVLSLSFGMMAGTIIYLIYPTSEKKSNFNKDGKKLIILLVLGIIFGGILGFICYRLIGMCLGIGIGMILSIIYYLKKVSKKQK